MFSVANGMHGNFYQDQKSLEHIGQEIEEMKIFLDILRRMDERIDGNGSSRR